jgi:HlyD family secretion protein
MMRPDLLFVFKPAPLMRYRLPLSRARKFLFLSPLVLLLTFCSRGPETTHPQLEAISESVYASGIVKSKNQYQVFATVNGVISDVPVTEGSLVRKGDVIMTVRNESSQLNLENAKLAAERSDLKANSDKLKEASVTIDLARAKLKDDSLLMVRQRNLRSQGVGSQVELEQRELAYKNSATSYQLALLRYRELERDLAFASDQSKTNLKISRVLMNDYAIRAEADGKVYKILKERGELANLQSPVAVIGDANNFFLELNVDEYDISRIKTGQQVLVSMDSYKGQVFEAQVEKIEPLMDQQSRSFIVTARFTTQPAALYPNLSAEANIVIRSKQKVVTIPRSYLIGDSLVMVGSDETRNVEVGIMDYRKVEIVSGLTPEDVIYKVVP